MRLAVTLLGLDLFTLDLNTDAPEYDVSRDLSGGTLASDRIDGSTSDCFMGFTAGMEDE